MYRLPVSEGQDLLVVDQLSIDQPKTKEMVALLAALKLDRSCLLTLAGHDPNVVKSSRNIPGLDVTVVDQLNALDICAKRKMLCTREAIELLAGLKEIA